MVTVLCSYKLFHYFQNGTINTENESFYTFPQYFSKIRNYFPFILVIMCLVTAATWCISKCRFKKKGPDESLWWWYSSMVLGELWCFKDQSNKEFIILILKLTFCNRWCWNNCMFSIEKLFSFSFSSMKKLSS